MSVRPREHIVREIEQEIEHESNPAKIAELAKELNDAMLAEQKEKVKRRLGISAEEMGS
jgi:hypothetical protein